MHHYGSGRLRTYRRVGDRQAIAHERGGVGSLVIEGMRGTEGVRLGKAEGSGR